MNYQNHPGISCTFRVPLNIDISRGVNLQLRRPRHARDIPPGNILILVDTWQTN